MPGPGEEIHHRNEDKRDNRIENLELLKGAEHRRIHAQKPNLVTLRCPSCGQNFERVWRNTHLPSYAKKKMTFCSRKCIGAYGFSRKR